jgi:uncharacterized membrane protein
MSEICGSKIKEKSMSNTSKAKEKVATKHQWTEKNRSSLKITVAGVGIVFLLGIFLFAGMGDKGTASASQKEITYPVERFQDGKARHFTYDAGHGVIIKYFIVKSSDDVIRAAFDACDVCWPAGKGYYQKGDFMVCRNCGRRFASVRVNEVKGGCNPAPLDREVRGDKLVIQVKDILEGRTYFDFSKRRPR